MSDRTSSGSEQGLSHEFRPIGDLTRGSAVADDREFLHSIGIEPYDTGGQSEAGRQEEQVPADVESVLINGLALMQFFALLAGLVWTYLRLN